MAKDAHAAQDGGSVDQVPIDKAYLGIPDEDNAAIADAKKTYLVTMVSGVVFIAVIILFIL